MTKYILLVFFLLQFFSSNAQRGWAFLRGQPSADIIVPGKLRQPHVNNTPGLRIAPVTWSLDGRLYLYGGDHSKSLSQSLADPLVLNMWSYDTLTRNWAYLTDHYDELSDSAIYGIKGIPAPGNTPGFREGSVTWALNGKLYLYGGFIGHRHSLNRNLSSDLWVFDISTNLWVSLSGKPNRNKAVYGTQSVPALPNTPGALSNAYSWVNNGKLYLFGGNGFDSTGAGNLDDIWEYDTATAMWTWLKGSRQAGASQHNGVKHVGGPQNTPGGKLPHSWLVDNKLYAMTGTQDMFEYDFSTSNWTWVKENTGSPVYGRKGVADSTVTPGSGSKYTTAWVYDNKLTFHTSITKGRVQRQDIWEFDVNTKNWAWVDSKEVFDEMSDYGVYNVYNSKTCPQIELNRTTWQVGEKTYMYFPSSTDAIWEFNNSAKLWRWVKGSHIHNGYTYYRHQQIFDVLNEPGGADITGINNGNWQINNKAYFLTRDVKVAGDKNAQSLWEYDLDKNTWTISNGWKNNQFNKGVKGVPAVTNFPGPLSRYSCWRVDSTLYAYKGGQGWSAATSDMMWSYDLKTKMWTWLHGDVGSDLYPVYGTKGVAAPQNTPGSRDHSFSCVLNGKLYLFGGENDYFNLIFNDLWEYDPAKNMWRWLTGDTINDQAGVYGTKGVPHVNNTPGARHGSSAVAANGKLYIFGGEGFGANKFSQSPEILNDLWEYDPATNRWTWLSGEKNPDASTMTISIAKGKPHPANTPGRRQDAKLVYLNGDIYLLSGEGFNKDYFPGVGGGFLDDVWKYDLNIKQWALIQGTANNVRSAGYDLPRVFDTTNQPGSGEFNVVMAYKNMIYFYYSDGLLANQEYSHHRAGNAMWAYRVCEDANQCYPTPPTIDLDSVVTLCDSGTVVLNAGNIGCTYLWSTNETTQSIGVSTAGKYWVKVTNPSGKSATDTVTVISGRNPRISLLADTVICSNDSLLLNAGNLTAKYYWNTGETTASIYAKRGTYIVLAVENNGCYTEGDVVVDTKPSLGKPELVYPGPLCAGQSLVISEKLSFNADFYGPDNKHLIYGGRYSLPNAQHHNSGRYYAVRSNSNGCEASDSIYVQIDSVYTPSVTIIQNPTQPWPFVAVIFEAKTNSGHTVGYQWTKNGIPIPGATSYSYSVIAQSDLQDGDLICVTVQDTAMCATVDTASACAEPIAVRLSVQDEGQKKHLNVYPNPASHSLVVTIPQKSYGGVISIRNITGQLLQNIAATDTTMVIDVSSLPAGVYILQYQSEQYSETVKIEKE